ncbi:MAG: tRNA (5-methylaminomethyl-2-thiouridine)(34)-methyltransferase MnmD [Pseudomonadales bacterium]|nr:tRNA (5-methylaminomethyl-2-thiouridine)(34)-methyltransferase MnmD [Pseudomonadales bacterium]
MIRAADLVWRDDQPYSATFGDIYHAPDGVREVQRVFLQPADFEQRLATGRRMMIGETGFGTGLNFAVIAQRCLARRVPLHFVSFESAPLSNRDFHALAERRTGGSGQAAAEPLPIYGELARIYPPLISGWHRRTLCDGLITLSLFFGDARTGLDLLAGGQRQPFDLWLLDGFAPDRNPDLWTLALFNGMAGLSQPGTRVTTFTSAGRVRRGLIAAGFNTRRVDQRPHKRESLAGVFEGAGLPAFTPPRQVHVIGAGLAGASTARHLAEAGVEVQIFDSGTGASGTSSAAAVSADPASSSVPITVMHGRLQGLNQDSGLRLHMFLYAAHYCRSFADLPGTGICRIGALQLPSANFPLERLQQLAQACSASGDWIQMLDAREASARCGLSLGTPALWFPDACVLDTPRFCRALLDHPRIEYRPGTRVADWPDAAAVLAAGFESRTFPGAGYLELSRIGGQINLLEAAVPDPDALRCALVGPGYLAPADLAVPGSDLCGGDPGACTDRETIRRIGVGATYEYRPWSVERATRANLAHSTGYGLEGWRSAGHHKALRCVSSDRVPIAGPLTTLEGDCLPDRYVTTGHGSMGTVSAHFSALLISAHILGEFTPATGDLTEAVSPARFRRRQARRGYRFGATGSG